jgi:hypothetical protein
MTEKIIGYKLITGSADTVNNEVTGLVNQGWTPVGAATTRY